MKTLQQHIEEKLIINKKFNIIDYYAVKPNRHGVCLELVYPKNDEPFKIDIDKKRILLYNQYYEYYDAEDYVDVRINDKYKINKEGYYVDFFGNWIYVLLFGEDALRFLKTLMGNEKEDTLIKRKMNIKDFDSRVELSTYDFECRNDDGDFFTKKEIKAMIKEIE